MRSCARSCLLAILPAVLCLALYPGPGRAAGLPTSQNSRVAQVYYLEGLKRIAANDWLGAAVLFEKSWVADPSDIRVLRHVAMAYNFSCRLPKSRSSDTTDKAFFFANKLLQQDTQTADAHYLLATLYVGRDREKAIQHFSKFVTTKINPHDSLVGDAPDKIGSSYGILGYIYGAQNDYQKSLECLRQFVALCGNNSLYANRIARARGVIGKLEALLRYKKTDDASAVTKASVPPAPSPGRGVGNARTGTTAQSRRRNAVPPQAAPAPKGEQPVSAKQSLPNQEYEKAKESLDKEFKDRMREIQILTG